MRSHLGCCDPSPANTPVSVVSEEAADLESIELVANEVLAMQMPTTPAQLQNLTDEIRQKVGELGGVETILQQSADDIQRAENLLDQARRARRVPPVHTETFQPTRLTSELWSICATLRSLKENL